MARIRSLKPEFWLDRPFVRRVPNRDARMLYSALWNLADEHARVGGDPHYIKGQVFPYEEDADLTPAVIGKLLDLLVQAGKIVRYEVDGDPYLFLPNLAKHQRLEAAKVPSRLPPPPGSGGSVVLPDRDGPDPDGAGPHQERLPVDMESLGEESQVSDGDDSRADLSARRADESEPGAEKKSLLYVAGSRLHVAGDAWRATLLDDTAAEPAVPGCAATAAPRGKPKGRIPKSQDPEVQARNKLAVELTQAWWDDLPIKPSGKFVGRQQIVYGLLEAGHRPDDISEALARCGFSMTRASAELQLKRMQEERERIAALTPRPSAPPRPNWCGKCDERTRMIDAPTGRPDRCPDCHPLTQKASAS